MNTNPLLPRNANEWARIYTKVFQIELESLPYSPYHLWDPDKCPPEFLWALAYATGVPFWDETLATPVKRQRIKTWEGISKRLGTRHAGEDALKAFEAEVKLSESFECEPPLAPGFFKVDIKPDTQHITTGESITSLLGTIAVTKRLDTHPAVTIINETEFATFVGCYAQVGVKIQVNIPGGPH